MWCEDGRLHPKNTLRNHGGLYVLPSSKKQTCYNGKSPFLTGDTSSNACFSIVKCSCSWVHTGCDDGMMGLIFRKKKLIQRFQFPNFPWKS